MAACWGCGKTKIQQQIKEGLSREATMEVVQDVFENIAGGIDPWIHRNSFEPLSKAEEEFCLAQEEWRSQRDPGSEESICARRSFWRAKMRVSAERKRAQLTKSSSTTTGGRRLPKALRNPEGVAVEDQSQWPALISAHIQDKYDDVEWDAAQMDMLLKRWEALADARRVDGLPGPTLSYEEFEQCLDMVRPDAAPGRDGVPGSLLQLMGCDERRHVYRAISDRISGRDKSRITKWSDFVVLLVPKKGDLTWLSKWRPICLVPALYKLYEICLWKVLDKELRPLPSQLLGFRPGRQCMDAVATLVELLRKADEWGKPLVMVSLDVDAAFDSVSAEVLADCLAERGARPASVAAALREHVGLRCSPVLACAEGDPVELKRGMRQGGPRTPTAWNHITASCIDTAAAQWQSRDRPALRWAPELERHSILVWADNIFIVADDPQEVERRARDLERAFASKRLRFGDASLHALSNRFAQQQVMSTAEGQIFKHVDKFEVLGNMLDAYGSSDTLVAHRLQQARKVFGRLAGLLTSPDIPTRDRLRAFYTTVGASVLWCAGCWVPSCRIQQALSGQESRWLRRMTAPRRAPDQDWVEWLRTGKRYAHKLRIDEHLPALWHRAAAAVHGWAGHVARKPDGHPARDTILWRSAVWWRITQAVGAQTSDPGWRHPRQNWRAGWEKIMVDTYHEEWWNDAAEDREAWRARSQSFVRSWVQRWGGPQVAGRIRCRRRDPLP